MEIPSVGIKYDDAISSNVTYLARERARNFDVASILSTGGPDIKSESLRAVMGGGQKRKAYIEADRDAARKTSEKEKEKGKEKKGNGKVDRSQDYVGRDRRKGRSLPVLADPTVDNASVRQLPREGGGAHPLRIRKGDSATLPHLISSPVFLHPERRMGLSLRFPATLSYFCIWVAPFLYSP